MKNRVLLVTTLLIVFVNIKDAPAQRTDAPSINEIQPNVIQLAGAREAIYAPSGKHLAIQLKSGFFLLPTEGLSSSTVSLAQTRMRQGQIIGFLPSGMLVFANRSRTYTLNPETQEQRQVLRSSLAQYIVDGDLTDKSIVIVSNNLIVAGEGNFDWGGSMGNIFRYDLKQKRVIKGAPISGFWYAYLSPNSKYILYEHGSEENNNADLYDVLSDKNHEISKFFSFEKHFPRYTESDEAPIAWLSDENKFLAEISFGNDESGDDPRHRFLAKIVWAKQTNIGIWPHSFQQFSENKALVSVIKENDDGAHEVYEISLTNGDTKVIEEINGDALAVSPDKKRVAFLEKNNLFIAAPDGSNKRLVVSAIPRWESQLAYKNMGQRPPLWSPSNDSLILFGRDQLVLVRKL